MLCGPRFSCLHGSLGLVWGCLWIPLLRKVNVSVRMPTNVCFFMVFVCSFSTNTMKYLNKNTTLYYTNGAQDNTFRVIKTPNNDAKYSFNQRQ